MKISEIKKLSRDELNNKVNTLKKDLFNLRFRKVNGPIDDPAKISEIKKNVAKILTTLNKKKQNDKKNTRRKSYQRSEC